MTKQLSAALATAAGVALISLSAAAYANEGQNLHPLSVNDTGPVLTAQQEAYQEQIAAVGSEAKGVAGRPGLAMDREADLAPSFYEVITPSAGGPIDD